MAETSQDAEIAAAIRELAAQVDTLGNAVQSAAETIAAAIQPPAEGREKGKFRGVQTFT
jgi:outer membrane murein-binding lipoprotein Lpp